MTREHYFSLLLTLVVLLSGAEAGYAQTRVKLNLGGGADAISLHTTEYVGIEIDHRFERDISLSLALNTMNIHHDFDFQATFTGDLMTKDQYFNLLPTQYQTQFPDVDYFANSFRVLSLTTGISYYVSPTFCANLGFGINTLKNGNYQAYQSTEAYENGNSSMVFEGKFPKSVNNIMYLSIEGSLNKILLRRLEGFVGFSVSNAWSFTSLYLQQEAWLLQLDALWYANVNLGVKLYIAQFKTQKL
jgi:hypothetical protein